MKSVNSDYTNSAVSTNDTKVVKCNQDLTTNTKNLRAYFLPVVRMKSKVSQQDIMYIMYLPECIR